MKVKNALLLKLHEQFADNQNHHQRVFVQFLVALITLFAGYGYIYIHIDTSLANSPLLISKSVESEYFAPEILLLVSTVVLAILSLLCGLLLIMGYGFRRDQFLNFKIRKKYLKNGEYEHVFGKLYDPTNKGMLDFLPDFYTLFFVFILFFQLLVFSATFCKTVYLSQNDGCSSCLVLLLDAGFILFTVGLYCYYYMKYNKLKQNNL